MQRLAALGLVTQDPRQPDSYVAQDPRAVARHVMADAQAAIKQAVQRMEELPAIEGLAPAFDPNRWYGGPRSEWLTTRDQMNSRIGQVVREASSEMLTAQPGAPVERDPEVLRRGIDRVLSLVSRGVAVRSVYTAAVHDHEVMREHLRTVTEAGGAVATLRESFPRMIIIDSAHLFIDNCVMPGAARDSGWHVYDRATVAWARALFEQIWARATRWQDIQRPGSVLTERQKMILRVLEEGEPQQKVGPRLGLAERTITKEIAAARAAVGARTVFQLMAWWGRQEKS
ncbi:hypothetical protein [Streptomyces nitrosporeus]|uniref:hypothetical protein n=1 Tax=Streptomyces nitrosporeus TaxID=28894 RepID=UPI0039A0A547